MRLIHINHYVQDQIKIEEEIEDLKVEKILLAKKLIQNEQKEAQITMME